MIRIRELRFAVGDFALRDVTLYVAGGEYFVLLGKPGSGKTLLLECLAGLRRPASGTIQIDGRHVEHAEPRRRGIGYVPQDYALFSRRTVRRNIEFGLRARRFPRRQRAARVVEVSEMLGIRCLLGRRIEGLSGGERQRVALARALASRPKILLLDEPVSALDDETREGILMELRSIQRQTGTTTIHVCHDLDEMRTVADRVGILQEGRLVQVGTPGEIGRSPADPAVARLFRLGSILTATATPDRDGAHLDFGDFALHVNERVEGEVQVLIRAGDVRLEPPSSEEGKIEARVQTVLRRDSTVRVDVRAGRTLFRAEVPVADAEGLGLVEGAEVAAVCLPEAIHVFRKPVAG
jgi:ABC-type Fe3+/spermidine/putrescine transport system ATPase subunit